MAITHIKKWGNSQGIRIPRSILEQLNLQVDDVVEITMDNGRLILSPIRRMTYSLDELLS